MDPVLLIGLLLAGCVIAAIVATWKLDSTVREVSAHVTFLLAKVEGQDQHVGCNADNFRKLLSPIHQLAEDVAELDEDLLRLQKLFEELKKRIDQLGPSAP